MLKIKLKKWGNSSGLILPKSVRQIAGIGDRQALEVKIVPEGILLVPLKDEDDQQND